MKTSECMSDDCFSLMGAGAAEEVARWQQWQQFAAGMKARCGACSTSGGGSGAVSATPPPRLLSALQQEGASGGGAAAHALRTWAFQPGSPLTCRFLAPHPTVLQVIMPGRANENTRRRGMGKGSSSLSGGGDAAEHTWYRCYDFILIGSSSSCQLLLCSLLLVYLQIHNSLQCLAGVASHLVTWCCRWAPLCLLTEASYLST
jgi:hypothetical protein